jgi:hypothetical protein
LISEIIGVKKHPVPKRDTSTDRYNISKRKKIRSSNRRIYTYKRAVRNIKQISVQSQQEAKKRKEERQKKLKTSQRTY